MMKTLSTMFPVNATSPERALQIAQDAAQTKVPAGSTLTIDALIVTEHPARPFAGVALQEQNVPASRLSTYVYGVTITKEA